LKLQNNFLAGEYNGSHVDAEQATERQRGSDDVPACQAGMLKISNRY
jgi:hypothetical protein